MTAIGGSTESVSLEGREFPATADADLQRKLGGMENEVLVNGNGTARVIKLRVPFSLEGGTLELDDDRGDQEFVQALANRLDFFAMSYTGPSGITYQGTAQIVGGNTASIQAASMTVSLMGPGMLTKQ